jgi:hypothetical protein
MWYLYTAIVFAVLIEFTVMQQSKYEDLSLFLRLLCPIVVGLIWPWLLIKTILDWNK